MFDVTRHLLRTNQHALDLGIIRACAVRAAARVNVEAGACKQLQCRLLQAALRDAEPQLHARVSAAVCSGSARVKHERVPSWQTTPSPSTCTRSRMESTSQSVLALTTRRRLPLVSPL